MTRRYRRRGLAMLAVLAVFAIVLVTLSVLVQRMLLQDRETRQLARKLQAQALAESALDRATAKLAADRQYAGETWQPPFTTAAGTETARVVIAVQSGEADKFTITITSQFPDHPTRRAQVVCQRIIQIAK